MKPVQNTGIRVKAIAPGVDCDRIHSIRRSLAAEGNFYNYKVGEVGFLLGEDERGNYRIRMPDGRLFAGAIRQNWRVYEDN